MLLSGKTRIVRGLAGKPEHAKSEGCRTMEKNITIRQRCSLGDVTNKPPTAKPNSKLKPPTSVKHLLAKSRRYIVEKRSKCSRKLLSPIEEKHNGNADLDGVRRIDIEINDPAPRPSVNKEFNDPAFEFSDSIYNYLKDHEDKCCLDERFLTSPESSCSKQARSILVDWLIQVQGHCQLSDETLHLAVNLVDQFLNRSQIHLDKLQLLGITCLFLASKVEECFPPEIDTLCFLTDHTYTREDVIRMERIVLKTLKFNMFYPSCVDFYQHFRKTLRETIGDTKEKVQIQNLARYMMDLSICSSSVSYFLPSLRATAALSLAAKIILKDEGDLTSSLVDVTGYTENELLACMQIYALLLKKAPRARQQAARMKYGSVSKYGGISQLTKLSDSPCIKTYAECLNLSLSF